MEQYNTMISRSLLLICMFLFLTSFLGFFEDPPYLGMVDRITSSYNKNLKKKHGLQVIGFGGAMMEDVEKINLHYVSYKRFNVQEARTLYFEIVKGLLEKVNADKKLRPFLHNYPFQIENLKISIRFEDSPGIRVPEEFVAYVSNIKNRVCYDKYVIDPNADHPVLRGKLTDLYEETYEEAVELLKVKQSD